MIVNSKTTLAALILLPLALAGCVDMEEAQSMEGGGGMSMGASACLSAVASETNNPNVELLDTRSSEAGNDVYTFGVGADPAAAQWSCTSDGVSAFNVMSLTNEGAL